MFIVYDFECSQNQEVEPGCFDHVVNSVTAHKFCDSCGPDWTPETRCMRCQEAFKEFDADPSTALEEFVDWLYEPHNKGAIVLAHNAGRYDAQFILRHLALQGIKGKIVANGNQIIQLKVERQFTLKDTFLFMPLSLAKLAQSFDIPEQKGYFPYLFDTPDNHHYVGAWPPAASYNPGGKSRAERQKFETWYEEQRGKTFDMQQEKRKYRRNDVTILHKVVWEYRRQILADTSVDPFAEACTPASTRSRIYRKKFMPEKTIGLIPNGGYRAHDQYSHIAIRWLEYEQEQRGIRIQHAQNGGEKKIVGPRGREYSLDGFHFDPDSKEATAFEFYGCRFHGCPRCFPQQREKLAVLGRDHNTRTLEDAYQDTLRRQRYLEDTYGMTLVTKWECELKEEAKTNALLQEYLDNPLKTGIYDVIGPRDALYGGRTFTNQFYLRADNNTRITHQDVCSEYPWACKYRRFPIGHPEIFTHNFKFSTPFPNQVNGRQLPYFGLIKCRVLPPQDLLDPVLPVRFKINGADKLVFPLCAQCAQEQNSEAGSCQHSPLERSIVGTWVSPELQKAIDCGYKILELIEVWHYPRSEQLDKNKLGLFTADINFFLKMKQEASGWPRGVETDEEKDAYIEDYYQKEGIRLDKNKIKYNPGRRLIAKLFLNTLWGKFGQRSNQTTIEFMTDEGRYFEILENGELEITGGMIISQDLVSVHYKRREDCVPVANNTNPGLASFVTTYGRLRLYTCMEELGPRLAYGDTDSVIYTTGPGEQELPTGPYLGDLTNEVPAGQHITEFVSSGPKVYSYKVADDSSGEHKYANTKMKGICLTDTTQDLLQFEDIKQQTDNFLAGREEPVIVPIQQIRHKGLGNVVTIHTKKQYKPVYNQRVPLPSSYRTVPFGYQGSLLQ